MRISGKRNRFLVGFVVMISIIALPFTVYVMRTAPEEYSHGYEGLTVSTEKIEVGGVTERIGHPLHKHWVIYGAYGDEDYDNIAAFGDEYDEHYIRLEKSAWYESDIFMDKGPHDFDKNYLGLDGWDVSPHRGFCHFKGAFDEPEIDEEIASVTHSGMQDLETPRRTHVLHEWEEDGEEKSIIMDEYVMTFNVSFAAHANSSDEFGTGYKDPIIVWLHFKPQNWDYVDPIGDWSENAEPVGDEPTFGLAQVTTNGVEKDSADFDGSMSPNWDLATSGGLVPIYPEPDLDYDSEEENYDVDMDEVDDRIVDIHGKDYELNESIFSQDGWYVPLRLSSIGVDSEPSSVEQFLFDQKIKGETMNVEFKVHTFVVGEWRVDPDIIPDFGGVEKYEVENEGVLSNLGEGIGDFFTSPYGFLLILLGAFVFIIIMVGPALLFAFSAGKGGSG